LIKKIKNKKRMGLDVVEPGPSRNDPRGAFIFFKLTGQTIFLKKSKRCVIWIPRFHPLW
jgi:hypothetical protein